MVWNNDLKALAQRIKRYDGRQLRIMEVCGTHTHENYRLGIRSLMPENIRLIAGPGCPVCVTPAGFVDKAIYLASLQNFIICSFGDLIRVPGSGSGGSLAQARARGADIRICYSPLDAVNVAAENPHSQVVFLAVGFETTTPAACLAVKKAKSLGLGNFSLLCACKTMENAYYLLRDSADAFLYPGHVSAITGMGVYKKLMLTGISGAVAGFEAGELLTALNVIIEKSKAGRPYAVNCYTRVVTDEGNTQARALTAEIMEPCAAQWRGLGTIEDSGLILREKYKNFDAEARYNPPETYSDENKGCRCGEVLRGGIAPPECPLFGAACTPENPVGACMVSGEGACAAHYKYGGLKL
jgi:hydrogenase expression/formation protein HypD